MSVWNDGGGGGLVSLKKGTRGEFERGILRTVERRFSSICGKGERGYA
jgi:hypothetical protein